MMYHTIGNENTKYSLENRQMEHWQEPHMQVIDHVRATLWDLIGNPMESVHTQGVDTVNDDRRQPDLAEGNHKLY